MSELHFLAAFGPAGDTALAVAAVAAVLLLFGGPIFLRAQRQRQQYELARLAVEKGTAQLPLDTPAWLQSMRAGVLTLTLGVALLLAGGVALGLSSGATEPAAATQSAPPVRQFDLPGMRPPPPSPIDERWHEARAERHIGLTALACGGILSMLGAARLGFARVERRFEADRRMV